MFLTVYEEGTYTIGGGEVHTCVHDSEKLCVYCVMGAEYAMRAHVTVLAWDRKSYFETFYTKANK